MRVARRLGYDGPVDPFEVLSWAGYGIHAQPGFSGHRPLARWALEVLAAMTPAERRHRLDACEQLSGQGALDPEALLDWFPESVDLWCSAAECAWQRGDEALATARFDVARRAAERLDDAGAETHHNVQYVEDRRRRGRRRPGVGKPKAAATPSG